MNKRYSSKERKVVIAKIIANPTNLGKAFEEAASEMGRKPAAVANYYYRTLRHEKAITSLSTRDKTAFNTKNIARQKPNNFALNVACSAVAQLSADQKVELLKAILK